MDGDILFSKKAVINLKKDESATKAVEQYGTQNYIGLSKQVNIYIDPSMNSYVNEINSAITQWNNVPNCRIKFYIVPAGMQNVTITNSNLGTGVCGAAYFPLNGNPGGLVRININQIAGNSYDQRQRTITHELGHIIGLRHTNWQGNGEAQTGTSSENNAKFNATNIMGTPTGPDGTSLMNGGECGIGATTLSDYDKIAAAYIYPNNPPIAGTVPVFRYSRSGRGHFYTADYNELGAGSNTGWIFEGIGFFAFNYQAPGTVPIYRFYNSSAYDHYYTTNYQSYSGYKFENIAFYAYPSQINGSVPILSYDNGDHHFYTKNSDEFYTGMVGYHYEYTNFYAY